MPQSKLLSNEYKIIDFEYATRKFLKAETFEELTELKQPWTGWAKGSVKSKVASKWRELFARGCRGQAMSSLLNRAAKKQTDSYFVNNRTTIGWPGLTNEL